MVYVYDTWTQDGMSLQRNKKEWLNRVSAEWGLREDY